MNICLYGASSNEIDKAFITAVELLGEKMAKRGHNLVYGAGANGLMGAAARGVCKGGGKIIGVVPKFFNVDGVIFEDCTELIRPDTMRERKAIMEERADAFVCTPGGIGTLDEIFEILSLKQLGRHEKAVALYNVNGYYNDILNMFEKAVSGKFMSRESANMLHIFDNPDDLLDYFENYKADEYDFSVLRKVSK
ncbi:MAG: TIGR00730 family Rossman fold protein [Clostridia bacterium]|nr:TIGR00730 family Rossman fold protein [Clostridia bacterium]